MLIRYKIHLINFSYLLETNNVGFPAARWRLNNKTESLVLSMTSRNHACCQRNALDRLNIELICIFHWVVIFVLLGLFNFLLLLFIILQKFILTIIFLRYSNRIYQVRFEIISISVESHGSLSYLDVWPICVSKLMDLFKLSWFWEVYDILHWEFYVVLIDKMENFHVVIQYVQWFLYCVIVICVVLDILAVRL